MVEYPAQFFDATGETLIPGTINISVAEPLPVREHFRIADPLDPDQDLIFEICRLNGCWAYRIRPQNCLTGTGGHGDDTLEISSSTRIPHIRPGLAVQLEFFR
jgi:hypothetical protein